MKNLLIFITIITTVIGCKDNDKNCNSAMAIKIDNKNTSLTFFEIAAVKNARLTIAKIAPNTHMDTMLCFDNVPKTDGHFTIHIKKLDLDTVIHWGYYTNGIPPNGYTQITVYDKQIKVEAMQ